MSKKIFTLLFGIIAGFCASAQTPSYDFESWTKTNGYETPIGFFSIGAIKSTDSHMGDFALELISPKDTGGKVTQPARAVTAAPDSTGRYIIGYATKSKPRSMSFWYKYLPDTAGGKKDSFTFEFGSFKSGTNGARIFATREFITSREFQTTYKQVSFNLTYPDSNSSSSITPDSAYISIFSSTYANPRASKLFIDDIAFGQFSAIQEATITSPVVKAAVKADIFPNPAYDNYTFVRFNAPSDAMVNMRVYTIDGRLVYQQSSHVIRGLNNLKLNIETLSSGMYILKAESGNYQIQSKFNVSR